MGEFVALRELTLTRLRIMFREPEVLFWVFAFPIALALGLGIAFSDPTPSEFRVVVERGSAAEAHVPSLEGHPEIRLEILDGVEAESALRTGDAVILLTDGADEGVVMRYDPTRAESRGARLLVDQLVQTGAGAPRPVTIREVEEGEEGRRYIDWLIPGLIGFNLMSTGLWSVGYFVTQARQNLQLKRLVATPMRRSHFLLAQVLARFAFLIAEIPAMVIFAWLAFGVRIEGSLFTLGVVVLAGAACFTGFGLVACSRTRTTEAVSGIINSIIMPLVVLSGVFFSTARFPDELQPFIQFLPLAALNDALRAVYNDGLPITAVAGDLVILAGWTVLSFFLALRWFRWQ
ncbi:MAG: ABC transporter permease [Gemmatimonadota bacterium]